MSSPSESLPASPCIKVCRTDSAGRYCIGCHRSPDEIGQWPTASAEARRAILARLPARAARVTKRLTLDGAPV